MVRIIFRNLSSTELESGNAIGAFLQAPAPVLDKISGPMGARFLSSTGLRSGNLIETAQFFPVPALDKNRSPINSCDFLGKVGQLGGRFSRAAKRGCFKRGGFPIWTCPSFFVLFCPFGDFPGDFPDLLRDGPGIFPICPFPPSRPAKSTYEEQSRKGLRHNLDLSRKKSGKHPGLETPRFSFSQTIEYFYFCFCLGRRKGEVRGARRVGGGRFFIENHRRGGFSRRGRAEGPRGCRRRIGERDGGWPKYFFSGPKCPPSQSQVYHSRAAKRGGGSKRGGFPIWTCPSVFVFFVLFCPFLSFFPDFSRIFPICSGMVQEFSRFVLFLFLGLLRAPTRNSPKGSATQSGPFPEKSGKRPGLEPPPGLASLKPLTQNLSEAKQYDFRSNCLQNYERESETRILGEVSMRT